MIARAGPGPLALIGGDELEPGNEPQDRRLVEAAGTGPAFVLATAAGRQHPEQAVANAEAVDRIDEIMAVPGIDVAVIGPGDLATSINKRGQPDDPEVQALMARAEAGILRSGVPIGGVARTAEQANQMIARGYVALALGFDWSLFQRGIAASFEGIKR